MLEQLNKNYAENPTLPSGGLSPPAPLTGGCLGTPALEGCDIAPMAEAVSTPGVRASHGDIWLSRPPTLCIIFMKLFHNQCYSAFSQPYVIRVRVFPNLFHMERMHGVHEFLKPQNAPRTMLGDSENTTRLLMLLLFIQLNHYYC